MIYNYEAEPKWITQPKNAEVMKNEDVVINCEVYAKPMPVYTWSKNGIPLNGNNYEIKYGSLTIKNVKPNDTATYSCIAQNYLGRLESSMKLYVLGKLK